MLEKPPSGRPEEKVEAGDGASSSARGPGRQLLSTRERAGSRGGARRKWVECVCLPGWHGPSCGVPTVVQYSNLPTKERLVPREVPRRVINAININHEFDLLDVRFHELGDVVDAFVVCESNFTAYGEPRPLKFREMLTNGTFEYIRTRCCTSSWNNAPVTPQASPEPGSPDLLRTPLYSHSPLLQPLSPSKATEELHRWTSCCLRTPPSTSSAPKPGRLLQARYQDAGEAPIGRPEEKVEAGDGASSSARGPGRQLLSTRSEREREARGASGWSAVPPGWHGPSCGVPTVVPRRVINAININHEFDLLDVRFHELGDVVDAFVVCESNFTAYGEPRPLKFREMLTNGTFEYIRHKVLYVFLDHFPLGGRQDGWIADDYLRTFLTQDGVSRLRNLRPDDVFIIDDADEIPARDGVLFLKLYDGWTEPFAFHMRKSLYGFFWKQPGTLEVVSGCTVDMLQTVYGLDGIRLRRRQYYTMPNFRQYENRTGHILVQWSLGSPLHFAGWHCSWCFTPEGIYFKLVSAQNGDFPRWGDYEDKRDLNYIRSLIRTGGWFDGTQQEYPPPTPHMYAPKYLLKNYDQFRYLLDNPYREPKSTAAGGWRNKGSEGRPPARGKVDVVEG
uniref:Beta-1,4-mannosyl-glycoprotein 4-beta-N-acetylglucosaminyltransferase n=1 Tax=Bos mutus grunniens TaxID=30521 RepID=A0A8B9WIA6_BOSMU